VTKLKNIVAVVDDEPNIRETASFILEMEGYDVVTACNGVEAVDVIKTELPKIVLLDVMMPQKDGYDVCSEIKTNPDLKNIYIIMLTAKGQKVDEAKALEVGADRYMTKPFDDVEILQIIQDLFEESEN